MCSVCITMNWIETPPFDCELQIGVRFLTIENNFGSEIHRHLCTAYGEENIMNLINVQWRQSMFQQWRKNIHNNEHER